MKAEILTWDPVCTRSVSLAAHMGKSLHTIHYLKYRRPLLAPVKYPMQFVSTMRRLERLRPDVTLVSNPPPFAALTAWLYHRSHGGRFVVDAHTGVFLEPKWKPFAPLNRFLMRRAALTLVTNQGLCDTVASWGGRPFILPDPLPTFRPSAVRFPFEPNRFNVSAIFSFYEDEPVNEFLAVRRLPDDMRIFVTGDSSRVTRKGLSPAMQLTGFLDRTMYEALVEQCDAAVVLCTRPHTMLCGAYEAAAAGKPLVTSESEAMRSEFRRGTVFVENTTVGIERGLREIRERHAALATEMRELAADMTSTWSTMFKACFDTLADTPDVRAQRSSSARVIRASVE
jgi:glycosyltransferase involved in cell wall biosynthesis